VRHEDVSQELAALPEIGCRAMSLADHPGLLLAEGGGDLATELVELGSAHRRTCCGAIMLSSIAPGCRALHRRRQQFKTRILLHSGALGEESEQRRGGDRRAAGQPEVDLVSWHGPADVVALGDVAAEFAYLGELFFVLHSFGYDAQFEVLAEAGDASDEGAAVGGIGGVEAADEGPVDLDLGDGQLLQVRQAGVAGAEVVQGQAQ